MKRGSQMRTSFTMIKNPPGFCSVAKKQHYTLSNKRAKKQNLSYSLFK